MPKAVVIRNTGDMNVMNIEDVNMPTIGSEKVLVRNAMVGLRRIDVEYRNGTRPMNGKLPKVLGVDAVGVIEKVGPDIHQWQTGERIAYCTALMGSYSEMRAIDEKHLIKIPDYISDEDVLSIVYNGMMAHTLLYRSYVIRKGINILVYGASGGVGNALCKWAIHKGCNVIAAVDSDKKANALSNLGCKAILNYKNKDFIEKIKEATNDSGVSVVYDPIGKETFEKSANALSPFGVLSSYGDISGDISECDFNILKEKSAFIAFPSMTHYKYSSVELRATAAEIFEMHRKKILVPKIGKKYNFSDIRQAHQDLENRSLSGCNILMW